MLGVFSSSRESEQLVGCNLCEFYLRLESAMAEVILKLQYKDDVRRTALKDTTTFAELFSFITEIYNLKKDSLTLTYRDDDGDSIRITCDLELKEAFSFSLKTKQPLKIFVGKLFS
jgi:hypothetical protein